MLLAVLLFKSILTNFIVILCILSKSESSCDMKWIRYMYMKSCGKKKREDFLVANAGFPHTSARDFFGGLDYIGERDTTDQALNQDPRFLNEILPEDELRYPRGRSRYAWYPPRRWSKVPEAKSVLMKKLFASNGQENHLGIRGFPDQWDVQELVEEKINEHYRRQIDRLLELCCNTALESSCTGDTFRGACK